MQKRKMFVFDLLEQCSGMLHNRFLHGFGPLVIVDEKAGIL